MKNKKVSKKLDVLKNMPEVYHTIPGEYFSYSKSQLANWLIKQPNVLDWLVQCAINTSYIKYDSKTNKWAGIDYDSEEIEHDGRFSNCDICNHKTCDEGYCSWDE